MKKMSYLTSLILEVTKQMTTQTLQCGSFKPDHGSKTFFFTCNWLNYENSKFRTSFKRFALNNLKQAKMTN
jgi:hypothetical protein